MLQPYIPILLLLIFVVFNAIIIIGASTFLSNYRPTTVKQAAYESGIPVIGDARERFSVKFYLVAMLFIIFDIETAFFFPWAVIFARPETGLTVLWEMVVFAAILVVGLAYAWKEGALQWR